MLTESAFQIDDNDFDLVRQVVHKHCGISLSSEKKSLVMARIAKKVRGSGLSSAKDYLRRTFSDRSGGDFLEFINAISTNLTSFFRENQHFEYLTREYLPPLLAKKRDAGDGRFLAWSAACSSGEEPYTLAMSLLDAFDQPPVRSFKWDPRLLATDISTAMLATARAGVYAASRVQSVPEKFQHKYFSPAGRDLDEQSFQVSDELRRIIQFRHLNLIGEWPFRGPFDCIFCRNVMIYFDRPTQQKLVERFWNCLKPGGLLFTGHSESLTAISHRFEHRRPSIYEKAGS